jgi:formate hydrogenlyase subunit 3/multisubunit Na+/H+ antiporter MnhD subunit
VGAVLLATNIALAVPLLLVGGRWAVLIGVVSLLGLPPFGGFAGAMLIAQSAANAGGLWLGLLLAGSALVGGAWLANRNAEWASPSIVEDREWGRRVTNPLLLLTLALAVAQVALFLVAASRLAPLLSWATVPWLTAP